MPTVVVLGGVKIAVYAGDHNPPHFHVLAADGEALVTIVGLRVLAGDLPPRKLRRALEWARKNTSLLADVWTRLNG